MTNGLSAMMRATALGACLAIAAAGGAGAYGLSGSYLAARQAAERGDVVAAADYYAAALRRAPDDLRLMQLALPTYLAAGRMVEAVMVAERLENAVPDQRIAVLVGVSQSFVDRRPEAAIERFGYARDAMHPLVSALLEGWALFATEGVEAVAPALDRLDERNVFRLFRGYHEGLMRAASGDDSGAVEAFAGAREGLATAPSRLARAEAGALARLGRAGEALALIDEARRGAFEDPMLDALRAAIEAGDAPAPMVVDAREGAAEALFGMAEALASDNGRALALGYARLALHLRPDFAEASALVAEFLGREGLNELAAKAFDAVPIDSPLRLSAEIGRARALDAMGSGEAALEALRGVVARHSSSIEAHLTLGDLLRRDEQWSDAAEIYTAAIDLLAEDGRTNWTLHYQRGICYERADEWESAEADFKRALELEPDQPLVLNYLGYSWVEMRRNLDEARAMIERAVELRPDDGYITDSLGWVLYRLGDHQGAVEWLERAIELEPVDPVINDHLGDAYWMVGRKREAEFQWRRARSFDPEPEDLARIQRKLEEGLDAVLAAESEEAASVGDDAPDGG